MTDSFGNFGRTFFFKAQRTNSRAGFTLTELVVILGVTAFLTATLLPALANTKFSTRYISCSANLRQWGVVASAFSSDNQGKFPSFPMSIGYAGGNLWDVDAAMTTNLAPYGATVPVWFCPVRSGEFQAIVNANPGVTITNPVQFVSLNNPPRVLKGFNITIPISPSFIRFTFRGSWDSVTRAGGQWWPAIFLLARVRPGGPS
ncbi:MAG TPA: hypothetical protein VMA35_00965 [Candidatus Sulfopaludibacter sp.]|nr:hypothetical protein [Candidatus Sulfopaludibacter sp.]